MAAEDEIKATKAGELQLRDGDKKTSKWKSWFFIVSGPELFWFKDKNEKRTRKKSKGHISCVGGKVSKAEIGETQSHAFQVVVGSSIHVLAPLPSEKNGEEVANDWLEVLKNACLGGNKDSAETVQIQEELRKIGHQINPSDLEFDENAVIGSGASGVVKRGLWLKSTEVAVKALKNLPEFTDQKELLSFYQEIETLSKLRHVNIVQMFGFCKKDNFLCLVTEYVRGGNLASSLENPSEYPLDPPLQLELALNIVRGMVYLHNQNIIHRDLKPANILIESWFEGKTKICDFGLSKVVKKNAGFAKEGLDDNQSLGSPQYAAPELNSNPNHDNKVDVFSFGLILWEVINKEGPWPDIKFGWEFADRYAAGQRPPLPQEWPLELRKLIANCWDQNPALRKTFQQVYQALEEIKKAAPTFAAPLKKPTRGATSQNLRGSNSPSTPHSSGPKGVEDNVTKVFAGRDSVTWSAFATALGSTLSASGDQMKHLEYLFNEKGIVKRANWDQFLSWFTPLGVADMYQTGAAAAAGDGWTIDVIVDITSPQWFHGFLESANAQKLLKGKPDGSFLFRFSTTNPGSYALSVAYSNSVGHWRISCDRFPGKPPVFKIDGREYKSLKDIVQTHAVGKEPLKIKQPKPGQANSCSLGNPLPRGGDLGELYQNV